MNAIHYYRTLGESDLGLPFITEWDTAKAGVSGNSQIALPLVASGTYKFSVFYQGTVLKKITDWTDNVITFPDGAGVKEIIIYGTITGWLFGNGGDRSKLTKIHKFGNLRLVSSPSGYFYGCNNLSEINDNALYTAGVAVFTSAFRDCDLETFPNIDFPDGTQFSNCWRNNKLISFTANMPKAVQVTAAWQDNQLESFGDIDLSLATSFGSAWRNNKLASFPALDLSSGSGFDNAWNNNLLISFPSIPLPSGTNFNAAWQNNLMTSFPDIDLSNGTNFVNAWRNNRLAGFSTSLPKATQVTAAWQDNDLISFGTNTLANCTNFGSAWRNNLFVSFPNINLSKGVDFNNAWNGNHLSSFPPITFDNAENCNGIFAGSNNKIADFQPRVFPKMSNGANFLTGSGFISTADYSELLIYLNTNNPNSNVFLWMGQSKYNSTAVESRASLIARGWGITDGGLE